MINYFTQIDDYIVGNLTTDQRILFELELHKNPELRKRVTLCLELASTIVEDEDVSKLRGVINDIQGGVKTRPFAGSWGVVMAAAAIITILVLTPFFIQNRRATNPEVLFNQYFELFPVPSVTREASNIQGEFPQVIVSKYLEEDFVEAIPFLETYISQYPNNQYAYVMLASIYLHQGDASKAQVLLLSSPTENDITFAQEYVDWYMALASLRQGDVSQSKEKLLMIEESGGYHSVKAKEVLSKLR